MDRRLEPLAVAVAGVVVCLATRLPTLGIDALWYDELLTLRSIEMSWSDLAAERLAAKHSPLYFWILKALADTDASEFALRLPSALFDSIAGGLFAVVAWRVAGRIGAVAMIILYAFGPYQISHAQEARPYALLMLFTAIATLGYVCALAAETGGAERAHAAANQEARRALVLATLGAIGAGLTMIGGWLVVIALQASLVVQPGAIRRRLIRPWMAHVAVTWVVLGAFMALMWESLRRTAERGFWVERIHPLSLERLRDLANSLLLMPGPAAGEAWALIQTVGNVVLLCLVLAGLVAMRQRPEPRLFAFTAVVVAGLLIAVSAVQSVLIARYFLPMLAFVALIAALGAVRLWTVRWGPVLVAALAALLVAEAYVESTIRTRRDFRPVARHLDKAAGRGIALVSTSPHRKLEIGHYLRPEVRFDFTKLAPNNLVVDGIDRRMIVAGRLWLLYDADEMPAVELNLPGDVVRCDWRHVERETWRLILLARQRADLPKRFRDCAPDNGDL